FCPGRGAARPHSHAERGNEGVNVTDRTAKYAHDVLAEKDDGVFGPESGRRDVCGAARGVSVAQARAACQAPHARRPFQSTPSAVLRTAPFSLERERNAE